jgi:hypothetical protein
LLIIQALPGYRIELRHGKLLTLEFLG